MADETDLPLVVYNIPGRTGVNITPMTFSRIAQIKNVVAVKEASGSLLQVGEILHRCGDRLALLSGDDPLTLPMLALGAKGVISATANLLPSEMSAMISAFQEGDLQKARSLHNRMFGLFQALFLETNPVPVKAALSMTGRCTAEVRLPLCPMSTENRERLKQAMKEFGLI